MVILTGKTVVAALRPPYPYGAEFVGQFMFALRLCWFPLLISTVAVVGRGADQESGGAAVFGVDVGDGAVRYLCVVVRDFRGGVGDGRQSCSVGAVLGDVLQ